MKINKRLTVKGDIDFEQGVIVQFDKDLGEIHFTLEEIFLEFNGLEDVTLTLSHDRKTKER